MILNTDTLEKITGISLSQVQKEKVNDVLIPMYWSAVLAFTNQSWFNSDEQPDEYSPQNPAIPGQKIPDGVVGEICSMIAADLTGNLSSVTNDAKSINEGGIAITYASSEELKNKFSVSRVISYYRVPSV